MNIFPLTIRSGRSSIQNSRINFLTTMAAVFVLGISIIGSQRISKTYYGCDPKSHEYNCTVDNCIGAVPCSNNTEIECHNNVCECKAIWWLGDEIFDCKRPDAATAKKKGPIPATNESLNDYRLYYGCDNSPLPSNEVVECSWDVCDQFSSKALGRQNSISAPNGGLEDLNNGACPGYPGAECYPNSCKTCQAVWWFAGHPVDCSIKYGELQERQTFNKLNEIGCDGFTCNCSPKLPEVTCYHDPCENVTCHRYPDAECRSSNCFQCEAQFHLGDQTVECF